MSDITARKVAEEGTAVDIGSLRSRSEQQGVSDRRPITVPADRYTSAAFAALEAERMWPRVWQLATTLDAVARPGDVTEFTVGRLSAIVLRDQQGVLRAFQNVCLHRGIELCHGSVRGLTELRCQYHRWCWNLDGDLKEIPSRRDFGVVDNEAYALRALAVDTWGPLVFVNFDPEAMPLAEYLGGAPADAAHQGLDDFRCRVQVTVPVPANWKTTADGFSETLHVQGLHPELLHIYDDLDSDQVVWTHAARSRQPYGRPSPRLRPTPSDQEIWNAFAAVFSSRVGLDPADPGPVPTVDEQHPLLSVMATQLRAARAAAGLDLDRFSDEALMTLDQYNIFPNITVLVFPDLLSVLRARPGDSPDECFLDAFQFDRVAPGDDTERTPPLCVELPLGEASFGLVLDQDFALLRHAQRGLHQPGLTRITLAQEEVRVLNTHRNLERYLGIDPSEIEGDHLLG
ncbi:MAG: aromatic ring-hydroxylating dioxygenase subunit alpha [Acidobacteria bacterium]|nr:aromatic ring-hydroxylating dioxygenase subunit alpha [Acidobacteriota bacterium]